MAKLEIKGLDKLEKALQEKYTLDDVKRVVRFNGQQLQRNMQRKADFRGHYEWKAGVGKVFVKPTGTTKRSIAEDGTKFLDKGLTVEVGPTTEYAPYVEYGTRFMEAQSFVRPAYEEQKQKFKSDMKRLVK